MSNCSGDLIHVFTIFVAKKGVKDEIIDKTRQYETKFCVCQNGKLGQGFLPCIKKIQIENMQMDLDSIDTLIKWEVTNMKKISSGNYITLL